MLIVYIVLGLLVLLALIALFLFAAFKLSPRPGAALIKHIFSKSVDITDRETYEAAKAKVTIHRHLHYPSKSQANHFDLYLPKHAQGRRPLVVWVHGGGFVGGDKSQVREFATRLCADQELIVLALNYGLAPKHNYPSQLLQLDELLHYLTDNSSKFPQLDFDCLILGGDSAGAQIALQYATVLSNPSYHERLGLSSDLPKLKLKGAISYCGPLNLKDQAADGSASDLIKFFTQTVAWSLLGSKDWQNSPEIQEASLVDQVTADFPPTFITDGNTISFPEQGLALAARLRELDVAVCDLFYQDETEPIAHEYQFNYQTPEAKACYQLTQNFIEQSL